MTNETIIEAINRIIVHSYKAETDNFEEYFHVKVESNEHIIEMGEADIFRRNHPLYALAVLKEFYNL